MSKIEYIHSILYIDKFAGVIIHSSLHIEKNYPAFKSSNWFWFGWCFGALLLNLIGRSAPRFVILMGFYSL